MSFYRITNPEHVDVQYLFNLDHIVCIAIKPATNRIKYVLHITTTNSEKALVYANKEDAQEAYDTIASYLVVDNDPSRFPSDAV